VPDERKIKCRTCKFAKKGGVIQGFCAKYGLKPLDVMFKAADCPECEEGEDLLKYEVFLQTHIEGPTD
jgi:hypothetical protein